MPKLERSIQLKAPIKKVYEILNDYMSLPVWNIVVNEITQLEPKKYFLKTNVGDIINIEVENIPEKKMTSIQEGSPMEKIGYIFESKGSETLVILWSEFELEDQKSILEMAADLFLKSLKVYVDFIVAGGNSKEYKKAFEKIKSA